MQIQPIPFPSTHGFLRQPNVLPPRPAGDVTQTLVWDGNGFASMRVLVDRARAKQIAAASHHWRDLTVVDVALPDLAARVATPDQLESDPDASFSAVDGDNEPWVTVEFYKSGEGQFRQALDIMWTLCSALERSPAA